MPARWARKLSSNVVRVRYLDREGDAHDKTPAELEVHYRHVPSLDENFAVSAVFRGRNRRRRKKSLGAWTSRRRNGARLNRARRAPAAFSRTRKRARRANWSTSLGLKNSRVGDARVSEVHGNFIVNEGAATADEVWS